MGFSRKTLTERRPERPPVACCNLPAGIFKTVTDAGAAVMRVCLVDLVLMLAGGLEGSSGVPRERRERRSCMVGDLDRVSG